MKRSRALRAIAGAALCGLGLFLALSVPYRPRTFRIYAGGCSLVTDILEPSSGGSPQGYVILLHGLAANKRIMSYLAEGFAAQGMRVFVPDLPGHGRTAGTFSYARADACSENLARELVSRGLLDPERTILAGHSLGGAIALRVASRFPVAGVVALSPAPMHPVPGIPTEAIPFSGFGDTPSHSLILAGGSESPWVRQSAKSLAAGSKDGSGRSGVIPRTTHVTILFSAAAMAEAQDWSARVLHLTSRGTLPPRRSVLGFLLGIAGILLLSGPFLREILPSTKKEPPPREDPAKGASAARACLDYAVLGMGAVGILALGNPLRTVRIFEGDYLVSFLLILGVALLLVRWRSLPGLFPARLKDTSSGKPLLVALFTAGFAAILLHILFTAWTDLTISEAWATPARWLRFLPLFLAALPYHAAEELILGPASAAPTGRRLLFVLSLRLAAWVTIVTGIFVFHSGEVLLVLLIPFLTTFCVLQTWAMKVVREVTASPAASALFGAILLAGFCLVAFPTT